LELDLDQIVDQTDGRRMAIHTVAARGEASNATSGA
jgi:hypothetical protein